MYVLRYILRVDNLIFRGGDVGVDQKVWGFRDGPGNRRGKLLEWTRKWGTSFKRVQENGGKGNLASKHVDKLMN